MKTEEKNIWTVISYFQIKQLVIAYFQSKLHTSNFKSTGEFNFCIKAILAQHAQPEEKILQIRTFLSNNREHLLSISPPSDFP